MDPSRLESRGRLFIGTAGWSIPRASAGCCPGEGTHLQRYARVFPCAEINSSFHRPHAIATYARWAASTPPHFRFAVKLPRTITHDQKLLRARVPLERFLDESRGLGTKEGRCSSSCRRRWRSRGVPRPPFLRCCAPATTAQSCASRPSAGRRRRPSGRLARHRLLPPARLAPQVLVEVPARPHRTPGVAPARCCPRRVVRVRQHDQRRRPGKCLGAT